MSSSITAIPPQEAPKVQKEIESLGRTGSHPAGRPGKSRPSFRAGRMCLRHWKAIRNRQQRRHLREPGSHDYHPDRLAAPPGCQPDRALPAQPGFRQVAARSIKKGRIVNILDWRALRPGADHLPYTVSKAALAALTRSLAVALAPRISVNGLALGAVLPPADGGKAEEVLKFSPIPRWVELDEVCQAALFLIQGPETITGEIIHVDGGRHLV